jgi:hypothetical protein
MRPDRLKARVDRLERAITADKFFIINPFLAERLRDDYARYSEEEVDNLRLVEEIKRRARTIHCPLSYGPDQRIMDYKRLEDASRKRRPEWFGKPLSEAEDAEEAQAIARLLAYQESPRGRRTRRIGQLIHKHRSAAEQQEFDRLCQYAREEGDDYPSQNLLLEAKPAFERTPAEILELKKFRRRDTDYPARIAEARADRELQFKARSEDPMYYTIPVREPCPACLPQSETAPDTCAS